MKKNIKLNNSLIHYKVQGKGIPVLAIHGFGVDYHLMESCLEPIFSQESENDYQRIYLDLPGMGESKAFMITNADDMLAEIIAFIQTVIGKESFILIGESYGAYMSLGILEYFKNQVLGTCFICPCVQPNFMERSLPEKQQFIQEEVIGATKEIHESFLDSFVLINQQNFQQFSQNIYPAFERGEQDFLEIFQKNGYAYKQLSLSLCQNPSCFFVGKQDNVVGYKDTFALVDYFPRSSYYLLDQAGHNLQIEKNEIFELGVKDWLMRISEII